MTSITIPNSVKSLEDGCFRGCSGLITVVIPNSVTNIGTSCFYGCSSLTSITIPDSITSLKGECFKNCSSLISITIPNSVTSLGYSSFEGCCSLSSISIPKSVTSLADRCFYGCTNLNFIIIPSTITINNIGDDCFEGASYKIYAYPNNYESIKSAFNERVELYGAPLYKIGNTKVTQTKIFVTIVPRTDIAFIPSEPGDEFCAVEKKVVLSSRGASLPASSNEYITIEGLTPKQKYFASAYITYSDGTIMNLGRKELVTLGLSPYIWHRAPSPTTYEYGASFKPGDAHVSEIKIYNFSVDPSLFTPNPDDPQQYKMNAHFTGCSPGTYSNISITVKTMEGYEETYTNNLSVSSPALKLTTLQPKCVSNSCAIVAAATNIIDEETNVGFQWKKYDAPESLKPNEAYAAIYDGQLEGYLKNLQSAFYYKVRAFYKTSLGTYYYGDWVTFDPSDFSYFEPTVHTYPATQTTDCTASVRGYVLAGTDNITEQGFEYWETNGVSFAQKLVKNALLVPSAEDINVVLSTGQVMQVVLDGLKPQTTYTYRAFVRTTGGTTYGEEQTFTTEMPTGIDYMETEKAAPTIVGYYDLGGRQLAGKQRGLVIVRYSDGTSRKVMVK